MKHIATICNKYGEIKINDRWSLVLADSEWDACAAVALAVCYRGRRRWWVEGKYGDYDGPLPQYVNRFIEEHHDELISYIRNMRLILGQDTGDLEPCL